MWGGSKEATIQAMMAQAKVEEMPALLQFAPTVSRFGHHPGMASGIDTSNSGIDGGGGGRGQRGQRQ
eukprot:1623989-Karenia_brevis.AAC.1